MSRSSPSSFPGRVPARRGILVAALCLFAGALAQAADSSADERMLLAESQASVGATVWGIVSYTRWPVQPEVLQVCIAGHSAHAEAIRRTADWIGAERLSVVRQLEPGDNPAACDLLYVGEVAPAVRTRLLGQLTGAPVLTIGEGASFCSAGGMFCLDQDNAASPAAGVRFSANLDAISRSGLRVNPQVLRLSRQLRGAGS